MGRRGHRLEQERSRPLTEAVYDTTTWRRSSRCADGACVEIADLGDRVLMRDAKNTSQPFLDFDRPVFAQFIADIENGRFNDL